MIVLFLCLKFVHSYEDLAYFHIGSGDFEVENNKNFKDVLENYERIFTRPNSRSLPDVFDISDVINFKNFDSVFPSRKQDYFLDESFEQTTQKFVPTENYDFIQNQKFIPEFHNEKHQRPNFQTKKHNQTVIKHYSSSYIQKIPKPNNNIEENNRYQEIDINKQQPNDNPKLRINNMLKRFLSQLYSQKFNTTKTKAPKHDLDEEKSKFLTSDSLWSLKNKTMNKINKFFSIFTIIKFNNTECTAIGPAGTYQGICYTSTECSNYGGTAVGNCADGYGVCCVFRGTCGGWANQNCSYFESPNYPDYYPDGNGASTLPPSTSSPPVTASSNTPDPRLPLWFYQNNQENMFKPDPDDQFDFEISRQNNGDAFSCSFQVYKMNNNIRQFRIDFLDLELTSPTDGTCTDERLIISGQGITMQLPIICGYNTGQHVYVDVTMLNGPLQLSVLSSSGMRKKFRIRICQLEDSCSTQSANCLQYYTGITGTIQSFNYDQAAMLSRSNPGYLNNLNYAICIRREAGYCSITYTNVRNGMEYPFQLTNVDENGDLTVPAGQAGVDILNCPDDYIVIDGTRLCGDKFNDGSTVPDFTMNAPVTDTSTGPIVIQVRTNNNVTGVGFKLFYMQNPC